MGAEAGERTAVEMHGSGIEQNESGEKVENRGLAGAVWPKHARDRAGLQREGDILDGMQSAESLVEALDLQECRHGSIRLMRCHDGAISP